MLLNLHVSQLIRDGVSPVVIGKAAHRILDWVVIRPGLIYVETPRFGWHKATTRELRKLFK